MSWYSLERSADRYGVVIDIGSGSVLASIVHSNPKNKHPYIVWSHRDHIPLRNIDSLEQSAKAVMTALVNVSMLLDGEGRKILYDYDPAAQLKELQCTIAAPWSYTVTKTVNYKQSVPFVITKTLVFELEEIIKNKIEAEINQNPALSNLGLEVIVEADMSMTANDYRVKEPIGSSASTFSLTRTHGISQQYLLDALDEMRDKLFTGAESRKLSFILALYAVTQHLLEYHHDTCLVDITYEATEIGIVRDGVLLYTTHTPFGSFSLAREISNITNAPLHESFGYLHLDKPYSFLETVTPKQRKDIEIVFEAYIEKVNALFHETGDDLAIPHNILLHAGQNQEVLFKDLLEKAAKRALKTRPKINSISTAIVAEFYNNATQKKSVTIPHDTALLLSAQFFHNRPLLKTFEYQ